ncbi:FUSC family protein [Cohnella zeiphila]|uniref:FUSC family protein n=1 Tax=Cohnella zeiphila TaxID=2761120 RepID=A0A7X0SQF0_9BACL|nr:FUSC family protein [Cohnella zeiphila]MBB6734232.1 FUSC family protein [Cohnella zeiphila]
MERRAGRVAAWASIIRQAFELKRAALPWGRAIGAGLSLGLPSLVGCVLGDFPSGMLAGTGGFAYLYAGKEPYALRSKKLFWAALGLALSVASGTLLASNPVLAALYLGAFGGFVTFLFGALSYKGPGALFFVMAFLLGSAMPVDSSQAFQRGGLALAGGLLAWAIGMLGWFAGPRAPEEQAISRLYGRLAQALNAVGTASYEEARHDALLQLYETEAIFVSTWVPRRANETFGKLQALFRQANAIYLEMNRFASASRGTLPPALGQAAGAIANAVRRGRADRVRELPEADGLERLELTGSIRQSARIWNGAAPPEERSKPCARRTPLRTILLGALDRNSIVLLLSLRFAAVLAFAALIARGLELNRSYWVPLSCASVMLGATVLATFHRAIQRSIGTMIGILAASAILSLRPEGYVVSFAIMLFTFGAELFLVRNYAITVLFVTPNALLMAEANSRIQDTVCFAGARLTDVLVGSLIGLAGVLLIGRRSASSRIP